MNVTFHALGSFATAAALSLKSCSNKQRSSTLGSNTIGFIFGILVHGILDFLPHNYPLPSKFDVIFALVLLVIVILVVQKRQRTLVLFCFAGAIFPDVIDLSAGIFNKHLGIPISPLAFKVFPWHQKEYSGSVYDGSRNSESNFYHFSLLLVCFGIIYFCRKQFLKFPNITK